MDLALKKPAMVDITLNTNQAIFKKKQQILWAFF